LIGGAITRIHAMRFEQAADAADGLETIHPIALGNRVKEYVTKE